MVSNSQSLGNHKEPSPSLQTIGTKPIAHIDHFTAEMLGTAELAEEVNLEGSGKLVKVCLHPSDCDDSLSFCLSSFLLSCLFLICLL